MILFFFCSHKLSPTDWQFQPVALHGSIQDVLAQKRERVGHTVLCGRSRITLRGVSRVEWGLGLGEPRWSLPGRGMIMQELI